MYIRSGGEVAATEACEAGAATETCEALELWVSGARTAKP
jgi:hypothetical protein